MAIKARPNETVDSILRRFKRECLKANILNDLKKHEYYVSPSEKKRLKKKESIKRLNRNKVEEKKY